MRLHAFALAATVAVACGETLPQAEESRDAGVDASPDVVDASDAPDTGDEGDAACTSAPCNVEEVAAAKPLAIAASTNAMVWLENAIVYQLVPEKAPIALMTPPNGATGHLAIDDVTVLMTEATGVRRCPTTGGCDALDPSVPIYQLSDAGPIAAGGGEMFVGERSGARRLVRCGLGMNCGTSPDVVAYLPEAPGKLALTTSSVVVALGDFTIRAYLRAGRLDGGVPPPTPLATVVDLRGLASSGAFVYWADGVGGTIGGCNADDCENTKTPLASGRAFPRALAVSTNKLYWAETNADAVLRCTLPACSDVTVIAKVTQPTDLAVGDRVYVTSEVEQKIYATAR
jgi:hypothetical protein